MPMDDSGMKTHFSNTGLNDVVSASTVKMKFTEDLEEQ